MSEETKNTVAEEAEAQEKPKTEKKEKKSKKDAEIEKVKAELEDKNDLLLRTAAEFDNYKKRTDRERAGIAEFAKANVIKELLPILDNIDRAALLEDKTSPDYIKGIELIVKQFEGLAENLGIKEVAKVGDSFDPNCHEAVMHVEDENFGENIIAEVLQKGFKIGDTVIRPAMVKVAN
ncbi:MAG: nucleotide exchange factor GrpE [Acutalibacteraceae bacterium]|nr:nucleotide exchange factor GrpE [Acutalibacteraceae bacterium]